MSAASSSSASAPVSAPPQIAASSAASTRGPAASVSVSVEDESTKQCSACLADRPTSAYSSAQLKKKGKRVCSGCVAKKAGAMAARQEAAAEAAAATRKEAMKDAFAVRLNAATPQATADQCLCCQSKAAIRFAPCIRCSVDCCSLRCFDGHDCDAYLEAARTMPTELIPTEDRFANVDELQSSWSSLWDYLLSLPASISNEAIHKCRSILADLSTTKLGFERNDWDWTAFRQVYSPCVSAPWWSPDCCARFNVTTVSRFLVVIALRLAYISHQTSVLMDFIASTNKGDTLEFVSHMIRGSTVLKATADLTSPCLLPGRLLHKLMTLLLFIVRTVPASWLKAEFGPSQVESDLFGLLPACPSPFDSRPVWLGYVQHVDPRTGQRTYVPMSAAAVAGQQFRVLTQNMGLKTLTMVVVQQDGTVVLDRGLVLTRTKSGNLVLSATTGWTGHLSDSFCAAPMELTCWATEVLEEHVVTLDAEEKTRTLYLEELAARKRPDYFHVIHAMHSIVSEQDWPTAPRSSLFIATPQLGIESELVELSLLESLVDEAAAGGKQAQLLLSHIESECAAPIAEVISVQKSRLEQMLEDQAAQLRIHAEAVNRAELRGRLKAVAVEGSSEGAASVPIGASSSSSRSASASALGPTSAAPSSSVLAPVSAASAVALSVTSNAAGSSTALSSASSASAASGESAVSYSWTASKAYASLASVCTTGRAKYKTITSAALRFLHTLRPVSVNRSGGSHTVFHFASGKPVTLVTPHGGDGSVSRHAATRLYAVLHEAALQQLSPAESLPSVSRRRRVSLTEATLE